MPPEGPFLDSWHVDDGEMTLTFADRLWVMIDHRYSLNPQQTLDGLISFIGIHVIQKFQTFLYNCTCTFCEATWTTVFTFWETQLLVLHRLP